MSKGVIRGYQPARNGVPADGETQHPLLSTLQMTSGMPRFVLSALVFVAIHLVFLAAIVTVLAYGE